MLETHNEIAEIVHTVAIFGARKGGKTSLIQKIVESKKQYNPDYIATLGVDFAMRNKVINDNLLCHLRLFETVEIVDFFNHIFECFEETSAFIFCIDINDKEFAKAYVSWQKHLAWENSRTNNKVLPIIYVFTKCDEAISPEELQECKDFVESLDKQRKAKDSSMGMNKPCIFFTSVKENRNISELITKLFSESEKLHKKTGKEENAPVSNNSATKTVEDLKASLKLKVDAPRLQNKQVENILEENLKLKQKNLKMEVSKDEAQDRLKYKLDTLFELSQVIMDKAEEAKKNAPKQSSFFGKTNNEYYTKDDLCNMKIFKELYLHYIKSAINKNNVDWIAALTITHKVLINFNLTTSKRLVKDINKGEKTHTAEMIDKLIEKYQSNTISEVNYDFNLMRRQA